MTICKDRRWSKKALQSPRRKVVNTMNGTNIIAGLVNNKSIAPMVFNGACNTELFNSWVEKFLIKELRSGQFVVMDNASFHKSRKTRELIETVEYKVIFLPPYSPDLNPIEKFWANIKRWVRTKISGFEQLYDALIQFFKTQTST